jgi:cytosine deaminase
MTDLLLRQVRLAEQPSRSVDVLVHGGVIAAVGPDIAAPAGGVVEDGAGRLVLPGLIDAHCHVDKTLWGAEWVPHSAGPELVDRIANERARRDELALPSADNAAALLRHMATLGTTRVRTHTDVDPGVGLEGIAAVAKAAEAVAGLIDVEQVAFPQDGVLRRPGTLELLDEALSNGATTLGGIDPAGVDGDPVRQLDAMFGLAARHGARIDMHLHDVGTLGAWQFGLVIERTIAFGLQGKVALSHADALGDLTDSERGHLAERLAEAGVALVTAAVYDVPVPPLVEMRARGVTVASGSDGIRDLWGPFGNGDMLERAMHVAYRSWLRRDEDIELALHTATYGAAQVLGVTGYGLAVGCAADFALVDARTPAEAVVARPRRDLVVKGGRIVARAGALVEP